MVDWGFAYKILFVSIAGTFFSMGILTLIMRMMGIFFAYFKHREKDLKE